MAHEGDVAYNDDRIVEDRCGEFCEECKGADIENAVVITRDGETYHFTGNSFSVDMTAIGDKLQGAKVIHNHPDSKDYYGDCFSISDFSTFFEYQLKRLEVVSGLGRYVMEYDGPFISHEEAGRLYESANEETLDNAFLSREPREYEQLVIMERLNKVIHGLKFRRSIK